MTTSAAFNNLPGPPPMRFVGWRGNMIQFFRDPIGYMAPLAERYGHLVAFSKGGNGPVLIRDAKFGPVFALGPESVQPVWTQMSAFHLTRVPGPRDSQSFQRITGGLFSMNDDKHRQQRKLLQPAFHKNRVDGYQGAMVEMAERVLSGWRVGEVRDMAKEMTHLTLGVANKTLFGMEPTQGELSLGEKIQNIVTLSMSPSTLIPLNLPFTPRRRLIQLSEAMEADLRAVIARKRTEGLHQNDVLTTLLQTRDEDGGALTDEELIGQLFLLFFAGHDTTKSALCWTLFLLSQHPDCLQKLQTELSQTLRGSPPKPEQMGQLVYLDRVIKESLRLFTPAPFAVRITVAPTSICGVDLPIGTEVIASPYCLHRNPKVFAEPLRFWPDRWEKLNPSPFEYAPFGAGPRMCLGAGFATLELKIVLSMLLQRFTPDMPGGVPLHRKTMIVLSPAGGLPMLLKAPGDPLSRRRIDGNVREMVTLPE
ncbi:MAG: cytochrome P450 [Polyangiaceae bacterium]|nr:cytochrome P450 [Polyangiaceae bacterium]